MCVRVCVRARVCEYTGICACIYTQVLQYVKRQKERKCFKGICVHEQHGWDQTPQTWKSNLNDFHETNMMGHIFLNVHSDDLIFNLNHKHK